MALARTATPGYARFCDTVESARSLVAELNSSGIIEIELEIGCSHGLLIFQLARAYPDRFYIGVEVDPEKAADAFREVKSRHLKNVAIVPLEGYHFLRSCVERPIFCRVHVYFPTPFPESIGLRDYLVRSELVLELQRVMLPGGEFRLATDHGEYFNRAIRCFGQKRWVAHGWNAPNIRLGEDLVVGSGCEVKYRHKESREIHVAALRLIAAS